MDKISGLPDELLVKILSFLPTKVAVSTCVLSKRWEFLWMWLPKLGFSRYRENSLLALHDFINKNLPLHRAPVLESLQLNLYSSSPHIQPQDIKLWTEIAVSRCVRELVIWYSSLHHNNQNIFPDSLFTCKSLVILELKDMNLVDVPSMACLSSLKTLQLDNVIYGDEKSFQRLMSVCPVLDDLEVRFSEDEVMQRFTIRIPSLQKLSLFVHDRWYVLEGYEIDTPCLKFLKLEDWKDCPSLFTNMPMLREAHVDVLFFDLKSIIRSITSVKHLTVCSEDVYGDGFVFDQLEHLTLCVCKDESSNLLAQFLRDSPNLRVIDISVLLHGNLKTNDMVFWNQPDSVPECLLSSLHTFNWELYFGRPQERDIVVYILKNARHLKTVTIRANTVVHSVPKLKMIKELTLSSRASSTCELVFVEGFE